MGLCAFSPKDIYINEFTATQQELHFGGGGGGGMGLLGRKRALSSAAAAAGGEGEEGGGAGWHEAKKTRAELLEEIIAKSKLHKVAD